MEFAAAETAVREDQAAAAAVDRPIAEANAAAAPAQDGQAQGANIPPGEAPGAVGQQELAELQQGLPQMPLELQQGAAPLADPSATGTAQQIDPAAIVGIPPSLTQLQQVPGGTLDASGKFKPIDLESLSPKSRQRVLRNRQAATRSKAKKKEQYQVLKDKKLALAGEIEQLEAQLATAQQRLAQLHAENKALADACKCPKE